MWAKRVSVTFVFLHLRAVSLCEIQEIALHKCPVCGHATLTLSQYTFRSNKGVVCSNCHTTLHSRPRLRDAVVALPFLALIPILHSGILTDPLSWLLWIGVCASVSFALIVHTKKLEPVSPPKLVGEEKQ